MKKTYTLMLLIYSELIHKVNKAFHLPVAMYDSKTDQDPLMVI